MRVHKIDNINFGRKPKAKEMSVYTESVNQGLSLLGKKVDLILHNSSAPAIKQENTGIGSLYSTTTTTKLFPFLKEHCFNAIQQEPNGLRKVLDNSPYAPESNAKNIFMTPLEKLASKEYGNILSKETFNAIVEKNPSKDNVNYPYIRVMYDKALKEAYNNGKNSEEFLKFKEKKESFYEQSAIYRILAKINGNDNILIWSGKNDYTVKEIENLQKKTDTKNWNKIDKNLYIDPNSKTSKARIKELKQKYNDDYNFYIFQQMILEKENEKMLKSAQENGIKIIGDSPVAPTDVETWVNQKLFLKGKALGCPPDYFSKNGQRWDFPFYNPKKMFKRDGSLGEAGEIMKKKYEEYFSQFSGGIRIDHIIGLIDPFLYTKSKPKMNSANSGRIYSQFTGKYQKKNDEEFGAILSKIIIPAAEKYGLDKSALICEDLGEVTKPTKKIMKKMDLSGISVTQFDYRGANTPEKNIIMLGSHDNKSFLEYIEELFDFSGNKKKKTKFMKKTKLLAKDTSPKEATKEEQANYLKQIRNDKLKFLTASFIELFASPAKHVQIFFADFWGLNKTYNRPGTKKGNWELRLGENFEQDYYDAVAAGKAPNIPEIIAGALRQRGLDKEHKKLMKDLDNSAAILKE